MSTPIIPWMGGKRRLADRLIPLFPPHECYVEVFAGGAALYFMRPQAAPVEVLNDINGDLVTLYRVVQNHLEEFVRQFKWALSSRHVFEWKRMTRPETPPAFISVETLCPQTGILTIPMPAQMRECFYLHCTALHGAMARQDLWPCARRYKWPRSGGNQANCGS